MTEYRTPTDGELDDILALSLVSFPLPPGFLQAARPNILLDQYLCAYTDGRMVAMSQSHPLDQWFGGRPVPCAGIAGVATQPEARGTGVASGLMPALLRRERERGMLLSALYPATMPVYRRLGYGIGGSHLEHVIALRDLPAGPAGRVREMDPHADLAAVRTCYRQFAATQNGCVEGQRDEWWTQRVFRRSSPDDGTRGAVVQGDDGVEAYAFFRRENLESGFRVACSHLVSTTPDALLALLGYFRRFQGAGVELAWHGMPNDPVEHVLAERTLRARQTFPWMARLMDVPGALEARGYPQVSGETTLAVDDPLFEDNRGPFRIAAEDGKVVVERANAAVERPVPAWALAAMYTGRSTPEDMARIGAIELDPSATAFLARLFAGPPPWMADFF